MNLEKIFSEFLKQEKLVGKKILLMISGGVDSHVLLEIAIKTVDPKNIAVLHVHHQTGGKSDEALKFVQNLCSEKEVTFFSETLKKKPGKNREDFWRKERKKYAEKVSKKIKAVRTLTAHHATDLVETMLFRLVKGTGPAGLSPFDTSTKPFWQIPKTELESYATQHKLKFITDPSNKDLSFERNLIRHRVIPELRKITPNLEQVFVRESKLFAEITEFLEKSVQTHCNASLQNHVKTQHVASLPLIDFLKLPAAMKKEFLRKIAHRTPSLSEINDCLRWLESSPPGKSEKQIGETQLQIVQNQITWK